MNYKNDTINSRHKWLICILTIVAIICLILYFSKWHQVKTEEKYLQSYLITSKTINYELIDISEIDALIESPGEYLFYISYTEDKKIYDFEKNIKPIIDKYNLNDSFYFLNITKIKNKNKNYQQEIASKLNIDQKELHEIPVILYFKDQKLIASSTSPENFENIAKNLN